MDLILSWADEWEKDINLAVAFALQFACFSFVFGSHCFHRVCTLYSTGCACCECHVFPLLMAPVKRGRVLCSGCRAVDVVC